MYNLYDSIYLKFYICKLIYSNIKQTTDYLKKVRGLGYVGRNKQKGKMD